jgi:hypothetical protein
VPVVQHSTEHSTTDLVPSEFPKQLDIAQVSVYGLRFLSAGLFQFLPLVNLLHPSPWQRWIRTIHDMGAMCALLVMVYTGHLPFPLLRGADKIFPQMRTLAFWSTLWSFLAVATGNSAYMRYRAGINFGGARTLLEENSLL